MRKQGRIDANQREIVCALRKMGATVVILSALGCGVPDLLVGFRNKNFLFEVKDGKKPPSARALTPDEKVFFATYAGSAHIIESIEQAIEILMREIA